MLQLNTGLGEGYQSLDEAPAIARRAEQTGFGILWSAETKHNPFLPHTLAAEHTQRIQLGTAVAMAFPRSPLVLAHLAWDLAQYSRGRFVLGLGSQVKGHIERRFGVPWLPPGPRLRDAVLAIRAIWDSWQHGKRLDFRSEHYSHTLMTPFFDPGPIDHPDIPIVIAGVNPYMCRMAGEVADGMLMHSLNSVRHIRKVVLPSLERGLRKGGKQRSAFKLQASVFAVVGDTEAEREACRAVVRRQISFYASTRTYKAVLDAHGWGDLCERLHALAARGEWEAMTREISDEMLDAFCVTSTPDELAGKLRQRFDGLVDHLVVNLSHEPTRERLDWARLARELAA